MRAWLVWLAVLWLALSAELAWPQYVPPGCLVFPMIGGVLFWFRREAGILLAGAALLVEWLARPTAFPLAGVCIPLLAAAVFSGDWRVSDYRRTRNPLRWLPQPLHLPLLVVVMILLQQISGLLPAELFASDLLPDGGTSAGWPDLARLTQVLRGQVWPVLLLAVPLSAVLSLVIRLADELGLRRTPQRVTL